MSREAMQMALAMLNEIADDVYSDQKLEGVITALRQALVDADDTSQERVDEKAKRKQEPVAWTPQVWRQFRPDGTLEFQKIKRTPNGEWEDYSAPPKREWVGLTDEEVNELVARFKRYAYVLLREVEAKLKEKNHG